MIVATHSVKAEVFCKFLSSECPSISFCINRMNTCLVRLFREEDYKNVWHPGLRSLATLSLGHLVLPAAPECSGDGEQHVENRAAG